MTKCFLRLSLTIILAGGPMVFSASAADSSPTVAGQSVAPRRNWNPNFLNRFHAAGRGSAIEFDLVRGQLASGRILHIERGQEVIYISGELTIPESGRFFFQKQKNPGKAGDFAGVVEFPGSRRAFRLEPSGSGGATELVEYPLEAVLCSALPPVPEGEEIPPLEPADFPDYPIPDYQEGIISLQSLPGATGVVYIDYRGGYTTTWGGIAYERPKASNSQIREVWKRVAEDYMPFNINVTTDLRVYQNAPETSRQRCVVTPTTKASPGAGGVAYIGSWNWSGDTPCWAFYSTGKNAAEVISHEVGHTLSLGHDGQNPSTGYFGGHGTGVVGWAPIMGVGYSKNVVQWSKGEYTAANNTEDDLVKIVGNNNSVDYRADDTGATTTTARFLEVYPDLSAFAEGVVEQAGDTDAFKFTTTGGAVSLRANPVGDWANLAVQISLYNSAETLTATANPQTSLWASLATAVPAGTYTVRVRGVGRNDPLTSGFSPYASLGYYSITGIVANAVVPDRFVVAENSPMSTLVGALSTAVPPGVRSFSIISGNTGNAFNIDGSGRIFVSSPAALNYETLAANRQLAVQYDLLVNINNLTNSGMSELGRRVVIAVTDENERPSASGFNLTMLNNTAPGTILGSVRGTDPDFFSLLSYHIVAGDDAGVFVIDRHSGQLRVAPGAGTIAPRIYPLQVRVSDLGSPTSLSTTTTVAINVIANATTTVPGSIAYAVYKDISGNLVNLLTNSAGFPAQPSYEVRLTSAEAPVDAGDNFGSVMRGYVIPMLTGTYTFYISSDDNSELYLSPNADPAGMTRIAWIAGEGSWSSSRQWNKFGTQRSAPRTLTAGTPYYIEARHKEGTGGDNLAIAWTGPGISGTNVIQGLNLAPYEFNYPPRLVDITATVRADLLAGARIAQLQVLDINTNQARTFRILSGNEEGLFAVDSNGWLRLANPPPTNTLGEAIRPLPGGGYYLQVQVADATGSGLTATANVILNVTDATALSDARVVREMFLDIGGGTAVSALTGNAKYPRRPDRLDVVNGLTSAVDVADDYGSRIRALLIPPMTGDYRFFIASDDASQLRLGTTAEPTSAIQIAAVSGYSSEGQFNKEAGQMSAFKSLVSGQRYYIEVLHKEGGGGDHVSVGWMMPGDTTTNLIQDIYLEPVDINWPPTIAPQTFRIFNSAANGSFVGQVIALDSPADTLTYQIAGGNAAGTFSIDPDTGVLRLADRSLLDSGTTSFNLTIIGQDSGYGGRYPLRSGQGMVTVNAQSPGSTYVWLGGAQTNQWSDPGNWGGATPPAYSRVIFGLPSLLENQNDFLTLLGSVHITNSGFNISGRGLSLQSGLTNSGTSTWDVPTTLVGPQTWQSAAGTLSVAAPITNGGFTLGLNATGDIAISGSIAGSGGLLKSGGARLLFSGQHSYAGMTTINTAGTATALEVSGLEDLDIGNSDLILHGRMDLNNHSARVGGLNGVGMIFANNSARQLTVGANNHNGAFSGIIQDSTGTAGVTVGLIKTGTGSQTLSGANTFGGNVSVQAGTLVAGSAGALGSVKGSTRILSGATLSLINSITTAEPLTIAGNGVSGTGALRNDSGLNTLTSSINLFGNSLVRAVGGRLTINGQVNTADYNLTLDSSEGAQIILNSRLNGTGGLVKSGGGSAVLSMTNLYNGVTVISGGLLSIGNAGGIVGTRSIQVNEGTVLSVSAIPTGWALLSHQSLFLNGTLSGSATIKGMLSRVGTPGPLNTGSLKLEGNTILRMGRTAEGLTNDVLVCQGTFEAGGSLLLNDLGTEPLRVGDSFTLVQASAFAPGAFTQIQLPPLAPELAWDHSNLASAGVLAVVPKTPPSLAVLVQSGSVGGDALSISWPADESGYVLLGQTNAPGETLSHIWYPVPDVTNNRVVVPVNRDQGPTFYRLQKVP